MHNLILNPHQFYDFAKSKIPGITYFLVVKQQFDVVLKYLIFRYGNARKFREGRKNYLFIPNGDNISMSRISEIDFPVSNLIENS